jgi:hypothetical protein
VGLSCSHDQKMSDGLGRGWRLCYMRPAGEQIGIRTSGPVVTNLTLAAQPDPE